MCKEIGAVKNRLHPTCCILARAACARQRVRHPRNQRPVLSITIDRKDQTALHFHNLDH